MREISFRSYEEVQVASEETKQGSFQTLTSAVQGLFGWENADVDGSPLSVFAGADRCMELRYLAHISYKDAPNLP